MNTRMQRDIRLELTVGLVVFTLFAGLLAFTVFLAQDSIFRRTWSVEVQFGEISTLRDGDKVVVRGMPVGKVRRLTLTREGVRVLCALDQPLAIHRDYRVRIVSTSMLGGKALQIDAGSPPEELLPEGTLLVGTDPTDLVEEASSAVARIRNALEEGAILENIQAGVASFREVADKVNAGEGVLGRLVNDREMADSLSAFAARLKEVSSRIERQEGLLGKLLSPDDTLYRDISETAASFKAIAVRLEQGEGTLGKLLSADDSLYRDLADTAASLKTLAARLENGEGLLGKLMNPEETLYQDIRETVAALKSVAQGLEKGEGTLGLLLRDEAVYKQVKTALEQLNAALDDYRETAPITAFGSLILGAL